MNFDASRRKEPILVAVVEIDGASPLMGILHLLGEVEPEKVRIGMRVQAVWKQDGERTGAITDIRYFRPAGGRRLGLPITERIDDVTEVRQWVDSIPLHYEYTAGVAGEKFLRGLIVGKILAGYCPKLQQSRSAGEDVLRRLLFEDLKVRRRGSCWSREGHDAEGKANWRERRFAFVQFPGVKGGIIHRLIGNARAGSKVVARFRPKRERTGAISDVVGFERAG